MRVLQKPELIGKKENNFKVLAHTMIETEKSHNLPSAGDQGKPLRQLLA